MSSLALMRWLESAPSRYDAGMNAVTLGRVARLHDAVAKAAAEVPARAEGSGAPRVLEIGCGTGAVTERLLRSGLDVTAIDESPEMIEQCAARTDGCGPGRLVLVEQTAAEIDGFDAESFDAVVLSLVLSDMSAGERRFVLDQAGRVLVAGGRLIVADETVPGGAVARTLYRLARGPQAAAAWLLAGSVSRAVAELGRLVAEAGFTMLHSEHWLGHSLELVVAEKER